MTDGDDDILDKVREENGSGDEDTMSTTTDVPLPFGDIGEDDSRIGHITVQDSPVVIDREEPIVRTFIDSGFREDVRLGNYIRIPFPVDSESDVDYPTSMLVGVINRLEYETATDIRDKQDGGYTNPPGEQSFSYVAQLEPISTVTFDPDDADEPHPFDRRTVDKPPKPGTDVHLVEDQEFLRTSLRIPHEGAFVGHMAVSGDRIPSDENPLPYYLFNPNATDGNENLGEPAIFRHQLVAGSTGSGKTHTSKNILRQLATPKRYTIDIPPEEQEEDTTGNVQEERTRMLNTVIIDPEDEYVEMGDDPTVSAYDQEFRDRMDAQGIQHGGLQNDPDVDFEVFVPQVQGTNITHNNARMFGIPFELVRSHRQLLYSATPPERTRDAINDVVSRYFREESAPYTYQEFSQYADRMLANENNIITEMDSVKVAARERIVGRHEFRRIFDHGSDSLLDLTQEIFSPGQVTVIPTGHLRGTTDRIVVSCLLAHIVENKVGSDVDYPHIKGTPLLLGLDEAHEYLTEDGDPRERYLVQNYRQAAKRGRKDKFGLYNITQNPQDIDEEIRQQTNTRIYLSLERDVVDSHNVYVPPAFEEDVVKFGKGQMVVKQPDVRAVEIKGLPVCLTRHDN